jgi:hypothetical protein
VSVERFLKQRAVNIAVDGSYTLPNWYDCEGRLRTFACRTIRVSPCERAGARLRFSDLNFKYSVSCHRAA